MATSKKPKKIAQTESRRERLTQEANKIAYIMNKCQLRLNAINALLKTNME